MSNSTLESSKIDKREFYAQSHVANAYDELRFGGASGGWVDAREIETMLALLPSFRRALDLGCGTGRLTRALAQRGMTVGVDTSVAMLAQARQKSPSTLVVRQINPKGLASPDALQYSRHVGVPTPQNFYGGLLVQADAFELAFADASFDVVTALRVVFHIEDLESLFSETARVLAPGGTAVFDTYLWSPRTWRPFDPARWGGRVYVHSPRKLALIAEEFDLQVVESVYCFLFSPYVYRRLPIWVVNILARVEPRIPPRFRARAFWKLIRT